MSDEGLVVTISASYGAGGSVVAPRVAELLGLPFLDRAIPVEVSRRLAVPLEDVLAHDGRAAGGLAALLASFTQMPLLSGAGPAAPVLEERAFHDEAERVIRGAAQEGVVILGRAAALVLAELPRGLHARLDGPSERRVAQAMRIRGIDEDAARREQRDADRARTAYVRQFYGADPADPAIYHVILDSTAVDLETCAQLIAAAARSVAGDGQVTSQPK